MSTRWLLPDRDKAAFAVVLRHTPTDGSPTFEDGDLGREEIGIDVDTGQIYYADGGNVINLTVENDELRTAVVEALAVAEAKYALPTTGIPYGDLSASVRAAIEAGGGGDGVAAYDIEHGADVDAPRAYSDDAPVPDELPVRWIGTVWPLNFSDVDGRDTLLLLAPLSPAPPVVTPVPGGASISTPLVPGTARRRLRIRDTTGDLVREVVTDDAAAAVEVLGLVGSLTVEAEHGTVYDVPAPTQTDPDRMQEVENYSMPSVAVAFVAGVGVPSVVVTSPDADELVNGTLALTWDSLLFGEIENSVTVSLQPK
jgi:hypothetical protein